MSRLSVKAFSDLHLPRQRESAFILFFSRNEKKESLAKKEKNRVPLPPAARAGESGTALRDPLPPPWTHPLTRARQGMPAALLRRTCPTTGLLRHHARVSAPSCRSSCRYAAERAG
jgi:hypothetical protein